MAKKNSGKKFEKLLKLMSRLRSPRRGCAWDRKQTHRSLIPSLREESRELERAIKSKKKEAIMEELGDLLLQIVFHCQIAEEKKEFTMGDVIDMLSSKLIRRHPHVFGKDRTKSIKKILANWEKIKKQEKRELR